jgi:uncharacterized protein YjcR
LKVRKAPEEFGLEKATEASISAVILLQYDYQKALRRYHNAEHEADLHQVACEALRHRKSALEAEVQLWSQAYFSKPKERKPEKRR